MADLAFGVAGTILEKLGSFAYEELCLAACMKKDLKKLHDKTFLLRSVLKDAEKKQATNERLQMWLLRVKDVFNDSADVLDEFECEMLRRQVVKEYGSVGKKVSRFFSPSNPIVFRFSIAHKVKEIRERVDEIVRDMADFQLIAAQLNVNEEHVQLSDRIRQPFVQASEVIGRDDDKAAIMDMLLSEEGCNTDDGLPVIAIVGIGGLGKTTLMKSVFEDSEVKKKFDLKLWVIVSLDFDVIRLERDILKEIKTGDDVSNMSIQQLHNSLRSNLQEKKLLLVLDDVWNEDRYKWLELRELLVVAAGGSKVIVTTRSTSVSSIMTRSTPYQLKGLSRESSLSLFFTCAFGDEKLAERHPRLKEAGEGIARKCHGVPLALKTLGSLLYSKDEVEWKRVRDHEIWELEREDGRILPALRLSYDTMSFCLRQCFAYSSTFPDDATMSGMELVSIWMALGVLHSPNKNMDLEDIAELQLKGLLARSFFQRHDDDFTFGELFQGYQMHDLIHELACSVSNKECSIIKFDTDVLPERVRHLRISLNQNNLAIVENSKSLWSLHIDNTSTYEITSSFLLRIIAQLGYLRVFDLKNLSFEELPKSIGNLKHLRYLNLCGNENIKRLPDSICELQCLQTLLLGGCNELEELPRDIRRLVSLRTLAVTTKQREFPENGIGRLRSLRTLIIHGCENLKSLPQDMRSCTTLRSLILEDCGELSLGCEYDEAIIELRLEALGISELPKVTSFPQWFKGASGALKRFGINDCEKLVSLPEWLPKCTLLRTLEICGCNELGTLPDGMQDLASLEDLKIKDCEELDLAQTLDNIAIPNLVLQRVSFSNLPGTTALPQWLKGASNTLKDLEVEECPNLVALFEWMPIFLSLEKLVIKNCEKLELVSESNEVVQWSLQYFEICELPETTSLPKWLQGASKTLKEIKIDRCHKLVTLPEWLSDFSSLKKIEIRGCDELLFLPKGMQRLTSLLSLEILHCRQLEFEIESSEIVHLRLQHFSIRGLPKVTHLPPWLQGAARTLKTMDIRYCPELVEFPEWFVKFTSLENLIILNCRGLSSFPEGMSGLTSLSNLEVDDSSHAFYERYQPEVGPNWSDISHVPRVIMSKPDTWVQR